jgi:hypothetical protein
MRSAAPPRHRFDGSEEERELALAMQEYRRTSGRMFPTWCEVLEVLRSLGYTKEPF